MKHLRTIQWIALVLVSGLIVAGCNNSGKKGNSLSPGEEEQAALAGEMEESLFEYIIEPWYPLIIDSAYGGYISGFERDWTRSPGPQVKALVQQARHVWSTSFIYENYPDQKEFVGYADHGFQFLKNHMWDQEYGGFHAYCGEDGTPLPGSMNDKRVYGQAFAVYALSQYYRISQNQEALDLAIREFQWMEKGPHDAEFGGYFEFLDRDGNPAFAGDSRGASGDTRGLGLKDYNSSIHLMEALTQLYRVWPDTLVRERLEEMFYLVRDTFVHPDGYLQLYFHPDWTLARDSQEAGGSGEDPFFWEHYTYGHDVETAFLLLETAHVLGWGEDSNTHRIAKKLVDHSLESGWDQVYGGFFDAGRQKGDSVIIINDHKSWWGLVEGMNALLLMHTLYPDDPADYYGKFLKAWQHIDSYLIDKEYGGWYNHSLDTSPEDAKLAKSHIWKTTYHNVRGMIHCIHMLRKESS